MPPLQSSRRSVVLAALDCSLAGKYECGLRHNPCRPRQAVAACSCPDGPWWWDYVTIALSCPSHYSHFPDRARCSCNISPCTTKRALHQESHLNATLMAAKQEASSAPKRMAASRCPNISSCILASACAYRIQSALFTTLLGGR